MLIAFKQGRMGKSPEEFWYKGEIGFFDNYIVSFSTSTVKPALLLSTIIASFCPNKLIPILSVDSACQKVERLQCLWGVQR